MESWRCFSEFTWTCFSMFLTSFGLHKLVFWCLLSDTGDGDMSSLPPLDTSSQLREDKFKDDINQLWSITSILRLCWGWSVLGNGFSLLKIMRKFPFNRLHQSSPRGVFLLTAVFCFFRLKECRAWASWKLMSAKLVPTPSPTLGANGATTVR